MAAQFQYAAFISYSSKDARFAQRLHKALESYRIPTALGAFDITGKGKKNRLYPVFRDREELSAGELGSRIEAALAASRALIVVCSPNAAASPWVQKEIEYFIQLSRRDQIFAVISGDAPLFDETGADATAQSFPPALRGDALAGGDALEPLAADARKGKDGFRNAFLKLVAGMIGVTPGQIIDRDARQRRAQAMQAAAMIIVPLLALGAVWLNWSRIAPEITRLTAYAPHVHSAADLEALMAGDSFQDCRAGSSDCPTMVIIPEGAFVMGSERDQYDIGNETYRVRMIDPNEDEKPQRTISVPRFAVSRSEITFDEWSACAAAGGCLSQPEPADSGWGRGDRPVVNMSWGDAKEYVDWLSRMTGKSYRLLTEAEWEYAARAATDPETPTPQDEFDIDDGRWDEIAWYFINADNQTHPVGEKPANAFGLVDMHGNAWEWVEDCYAPYDPDHLSISAVESSATLPAAGDGPCPRVMRGGSWNGIDTDLRPANRERMGADVRSSEFGLRVARDLAD